MTKDEREKQQRHLTYKQRKLLNIAQDFKARLTNDKTLSEVHLEKILLNLNIVFEEQKIILGLGKFWIPDFYLPDYNLIIELDGHHHYTHSGFIRDAERDSNLIELGFTKILRIPNKTAMTLDEHTFKLTLEDWGIHLLPDNF